jgi:uncharacterized protein (DUF885 family)
MTTLDRLIDGFLAHHFEESPSVATMHGVDGYDDRMPDLSAAGYARRAAADDESASAFAALADDDLSEDERIDRDLVLSHLRGRAIMREWEAWRRHPDAYLNPGLMGVFSLFLRRLHPEPELAAAAVARMEAVPEMLDHGRANLQAELVHPLMAERAIGQCRAAIRYTRELVATEVSDDTLRARVADAGAVAADAYESYLGFLDDLRSRASGDFALGEDRYSALLREKELLGFDARTLRARGQGVYDELADEMAALARDLRGTDDWRAVLDELSEDRPQTPDDMRAGYERCTDAARQFLVDNELVTLPAGEACEVVPSPPFQRPVLAVASYFSPPAFRPGLVGRFNVPYPPDGTPDDDVAKRLADNSYPAMWTTTVHEAYPGHHWHYARLQSVGRPIRKVLTTPYYSEGWALYAERMMREQGFFTDKGAELCHLEARIFRAARIVVDTSLHSGEMTPDEAIDFMHRRTKLTEPVARAEVIRYCAWPTQAASYLTGALEIERIRSQWTGGLREFHDTICGSGALPIALAERAVLGA